MYPTLDTFGLPPSFLSLTLLYEAGEAVVAGLEAEGLALINGALGRGVVTAGGGAGLSLAVAGGVGLICQGDSSPRIHAPAKKPTPPKDDYQVSLPDVFRCIYRMDGECAWIRTLWREVQTKREASVSTSPTAPRAIGNPDDKGGDLILFPITQVTPAATPSKDPSATTDEGGLDAQVIRLTHTHTPKTTGPNEASSVAEFMPPEFFDLNDAIKEMAGHLSTLPFDSPWRFGIVRDLETDRYLIVRRRGEITLSSRYELVATGTRLGSGEDALAALPGIEEMHEVGEDTVITVGVWSRTWYTILHTTATPETLKSFRKRTLADDVPLAFDLEQRTVNRGASQTTHSLLILHPTNPDVVVQIPVETLQEFKKNWLQGKKDFSAYLLLSAVDEDRKNDATIKDALKVRLRPTADGKGALLTFQSSWLKATPQRDEHDILYLDIPTPHSDPSVDVYIPLPQKSLRKDHSKP